MAVLGDVTATARPVTPPPWGRALSETGDDARADGTACGHDCTTRIPTRWTNASANDGTAPADAQKTGKVSKGAVRHTMIAANRPGRPDRGVAGGARDGAERCRFPEEYR